MLRDTLYFSSPARPGFPTGRYYFRLPSRLWTQSLIRFHSLVLLSLGTILLMLVLFILLLILGSFMTFVAPFLCIPREDGLPFLVRSMLRKENVRSEKVWSRMFNRTLLAKGNYVLLAMEEYITMFYKSM